MYFRIALSISESTNEPDHAHNGEIVPRVRTWRPISLNLGLMSSERTLVLYTVEVLLDGTALGGLAALGRSSPPRCICWRPCCHTS